MPKIIVTGASGLIGSKFCQMLASKYEFETLDISNPQNPVDITNADSVKTALEKSSAEFVVHFAAFTNVTEAFNQTGDKNGLAYKVNVAGTKNILDVCQQFHKHLVHISTAYVFDGNIEGQYTEDDAVNPLEWYGQTKMLAEQLIQDSREVDWTIFRIDQPFRQDPFSRADIAHRITAALKDGSLYPQFTNHFFGPTIIEDFVRVIEWCISTKTTGLFHATSGEKWSDFEFASLINSKLGLGGVVKPGDINQYLKTLNRPYQRNTSLNVDKLKKLLNFELTSIDSAVSRLQF